MSEYNRGEEERPRQATGPAHTGWCWEGEWRSWRFGAQRERWSGFQQVQDGAQQVRRWAHCVMGGGTRVHSERIGKKKSQHPPAGKKLESALSGHLRHLYSKGQERVKQSIHMCFP